MNPKLFSEVEENLYGQSLEPLQQLQKWAKIRREKEVENMELNSPDTKYKLKSNRNPNLKLNLDYEGDENENENNYENSNRGSPSKNKNKNKNRNVLDEDSAEREE